MDPAGRLQHVTVITAETYLPVWKDDRAQQTEGETLHGVGLSVPVPYAVLYAHRGQQVMVQGRLAVDGVTPYYWHATRLAVVSLRLADGTELVKPVAAAAPPAAGVRAYTATAVLPADLAEPWRYRQAGAGRQSLPADGLLSCSSNGGGDVVNCGCAEGFEAKAADAVLGGRHATGRLLGSSAQFDVTDKDGNTAFATTLVMTCTR